MYRSSPTSAMPLGDHSECDDAGPPSPFHAPWPEPANGNTAPLGDTCNTRCASVATSSVPSGRMTRSSSLPIRASGARYDSRPPGEPGHGDCGECPCGHGSTECRLHRTLISTAARAGLWTRRSRSSSSSPGTIVDLTRGLPPPDLHASTRYPRARAARANTQRFREDVETASLGWHMPVASRSRRGR